jgi:predicted homoserine dehydrogenase-like protein
VQGAVEARLDIVEVAQQALDAAAEAARQTGLSAETAETEAAAGIMEAAVAAGPEAVTKVKTILPSQLQ